MKIDFLILAPTLILAMAGLSLAPEPTRAANATGAPALAAERSVRNGSPRLPEGAQVRRDLAYVPGGHERQKLDL